MQISSVEISKLLAAQNAGLTRHGKTELHFAQVAPESLPETVEPDAAEVAKVVAMVQSEPDVREDIVMELRERIEKGEYKVSGEEIADMMVRRMRADSIR